MSRNPQEPWRPPEPPGRPPRPPMPNRNPVGGSPKNRYVPWIVVGVLVLVFFVIFSNGINSGPHRAKLTFDRFQTAIEQGKVKSITYNQDSGAITGKFKTVQRLL